MQKIKGPAPGAFLKMPVAFQSVGVMATRSLNIRSMNESNDFTCASIDSIIDCIRSTKLSPIYESRLLKTMLVVLLLLNNGAQHDENVMFCFLTFN